MVCISTNMCARACAFMRVRVCTVRFSKTVFHGIKDYYLIVPILLIYTPEFLVCPKCVNMTKLTRSTILSDRDRRFNTFNVKRPPLDVTLILPHSQLLSVISPSPSRYSELPHHRKFPHQKSVLISCPPAIPVTCPVHRPLLRFTILTWLGNRQKPQVLRYVDLP
jgi:hypothetical protein